MNPKLTFVLAAILTFQFAPGQITLNFRKTAMTVEVGKEDVTIPVELEIGKTVPRLTVRIELNMETAQSTLRDSGLAKISKRENEITFQMDKNPVVRAFYIVVKKEIVMDQDSTIVYNAVLTGGPTPVSTPAPVVITLTKTKNAIYSLKDYFDDQKGKLGYVTKVESNNDILTVYGYSSFNRNMIVKRQIALQDGQIYSVGDKVIRLYKPQVSLITVPFKIRPKQDALNTTAVSGLSNLGFNIDFVGYKREWYYPNGNKKTLRVSLPGIFIAPAVEELDSAMTKGFLKGSSKSKQLFISTGLTFTIAINNLTFVFVPVGYDWATTDVGRKWVYNKRRWWGFGIGVDPKFLTSGLFK
jgi:hypothetical protein